MRPDRVMDRTGQITGRTVLMWGVLRERAERAAAMTNVARSGMSVRAQNSDRCRAPFNDGSTPPAFTGEVAGDWLW